MAENFIYLNINKLFDPLGSENTFRVLENAANDTQVGTVVRSDGQTQDVVFEFDDSGIPAELQVRADDHIEGAADAPAVLIEYLSLQCPHCAQAQPLVEEVLTQFDGDLQVIRRHLPLTGTFVHAFDAALAAEAAGRQGMFNEMVAELFARQSEWAGGNDPSFDSQAIFEDIAIGLGLNLTQFRNDMNDPLLADRVNRDIADASALNFSGTPTFFLNGQQVMTPDPANTSSVDQFKADIQTAIDEGAAANAIALKPDDHFEGASDAKVVLIEYLSLQCPHCAQAQPEVQQLLSDFAGDILVVRRHQPIDTANGGPFEHSFEAAIAAEAADRQGAFDAMVDELFSRQAEWTNSVTPAQAQTVFEDIATGLGLNLTQFRNDMSDPDLAARVQHDIDDAATLGVGGTPTFFLDGQLIQAPDFTDATQVAQFRTTIDDAINAFNDTFYLNRLTGEITVADSTDLDFETNPSFMLDVRSTNDTTEIINVTINVIDVFNDG